MRTPQAPPKVTAQVAKIAKVETGQRPAALVPDAETLERARKILAGEMTPAQAVAELDAKVAGPGETDSH